MLVPNFHRVERSLTTSYYSDSKMVYDLCREMCPVVVSAKVA